MFRTCIVDTDTNIVMNVIEYETQQTGIPPGFDHPLLCVPSEIGQIGDNYLNGEFISSLPPEKSEPKKSDEEKKEICKQKATLLLFTTDWTQMPDCFLVNRQEFIDYRAYLRNLAINPVANPVWPERPTSIWE